MGGIWQAKYDSVPQATDPSVYVRTYVYVPVSPDAITAISSVVEAQTPYNGVRVLLQPSGLVSLHSTLGGADATTTDALPTDRWTCLEWQVKAGTTGFINLWIDDVLAAHFDGNTRPATPLAQAGLGEYFLTGSPTPFEIWFDDVVIDGQRITCRQ
jgi:hypothetical protein